MLTEFRFRSGESVEPRGSCARGVIAERARDALFGLESPPSALPLPFVAFCSRKGSFPTKARKCAQSQRSFF